MKEDELRELLRIKGYELLRVRKCKKHDQVRFGDANMTANWILRDGWHLENLEPKHIHQILPENKES